MYDFVRAGQKKRDCFVFYFLSIILRAIFERVQKEFIPHTISAAIGQILFQKHLKRHPLAERVISVAGSKRYPYRHEYLGEAKAINDNNHTMARMIGQHAKAAAENAIDRDTATALRSVSYKSNGMNGSNYVEAFDFVTGLYDRCSRNPALYSKWDELAGEVIEKF